MATSWEDLELNDLSLKDLRITTPPPPPPGRKQPEHSIKPVLAQDHGATSHPRPGNAPVVTVDGAASNPHGVDKALLDTLGDSKERMQVLRFEVEIERFIQDSNCERFEFPGHLTPFQRMIAHRVAQHYFLQTSVETMDSGVHVVAWKLPRMTHKPTIRLVDIPMACDGSGSALDSGSSCMGTSEPGSTGVVKVMRRIGSREGPAGADQQQGKSMDADTMERIARQREEEYNIARQRIFSSGNLAVGSGSEGEFEGDVSEPSEPSRVLAEAGDSPICLAGDVAVPSEQSGDSRDGNSATDLNGVGRVSSPTGSASGKAFGGSASGSKSRPGSGKDGRRGRQLAGEGENGEEISQNSGGKGRGRSGRQKAVFRDKDKDSLDPDFRRGRHRFEQRFDSNAYGAMPVGSGTHGGLYAMPTYAAEFPTLGGGHHPGRPIVPHMLPPPPPPPQPASQSPQGQHQQQWHHGGGQQGVPHGLISPSYLGQPPRGHPTLPPPQYGSMQAQQPSYGMHPMHAGQAGIYHPPPPLPFGGIPMPPAGHYGFMPHMQPPAASQQQKAGLGPVSQQQFRQPQTFAMQQQQYASGAEGVASLVTPPPTEGSHQQPPLPQ